MTRTRAYYNEIDPHAAEWLRSLMSAGLIMEGEVDERSICDVQPADLAGYRRCHFFAGIAGWEYALQLAGWPDEVEVWTGSCPCQPFSAAGKRKGAADERHLWPEFARLIRACQPATVFGEQVASKDGREWLAGVFADLEGMGYQRAGADLCAAGVGAPHIRQRLYWVANSEISERERVWTVKSEAQNRLADGSGIGGMGHSNGSGSFTRELAAETNGHGSPAIANGGDCGMEHPKSHRRQQRGPEPDGRIDSHATGPVATAGRDCWSDYIIVPCGDGKARRIKPGLEPLAHGVSGRVAQLRGLGNAIVPDQAAVFIQATAEAFELMQESR